MPPNRRMDEENVVHLYKMVLLSGKKKIMEVLKDEAYISFKEIQEKDYQKQEAELLSLLG